MRKKLISFTLAAALLVACATCASAAEGGGEVLITLSDQAVTVDGQAVSQDPSAAVYTGGDIIYYQDGTDSTYGEGTAGEMHSAQEAEAHTVVTITQPGTYRITGTLSLGQIFVDLGEDARTDPGAVVTLILDNADITCTVAPAVFFYRVYECDQAWVSYDEGEAEEYQPSGAVDTSAAGANVVIAAGSENNITGSHVARIYQEGTTKKLHKYDGAFYSKMSMNLNGDGGDDSGVLNIVADNEGLDSELHLTINGGTIRIQSQDDGINTNEDGVSVTTVNGGSLTVNAGLGSEGDGIDSNGYLTINGGAVWTMANETSPDGGLDADAAITLNGGTVYAFGTRNDAADNASAQPYLELFFASTLPAGSTVSLQAPDGTEVMEAVLQKNCQSITFTSPDLEEGVAYTLYVDGVQQQYTGNQSGMMGGRPGGGFGGFDPGQGGQPPEDFDPSQRPQRPEDGEPPEGFDPGQRPEDFDPGQAEEPPQDMTPPDGAGESGTTDVQGSTEFTITSAIHTFSGVSDSPDGAGKTRVTFTVNGGAGIASVASGQTVSLTGITASVSGLPDSDVQITVTDVPRENYAETCLLSDGMEAVAALLPTDDGTYQLTVAVVSGNEAYAGVSQWQFTVGVLPFSDVRQNSPYYDAVKYVYDAGLMEGTGESTFSPDAAVTRAQAVTVLARLAGAQAAESSAFSDVAAGSWYSGYVGWAVENGIVQGDGQGHFLPDSAVTGEHMELMLTRYAQANGIDYTASNTSGEALTRAGLAQMLAAFAQAME